MRRVAAALALFALAGCGLCGKKPEPPPAPPAPPSAAPATEQPATVELTAVQGEVQVLRGARGEWVAARIPLSLGLDDSIRTPAGGAATLRVGRDGAIEVRERTELSVRQLLVNRARFRVERGRVRATPGPSRVAVAFESSGSSAVAEASTGSFAVFNDGKGLVAVVAEAGEVKLTSAGGDTLLAAGQGARVLGSAAPAGEAVPRSVLLKVAWPEEKITRQVSVTLRGEADPGAVVSINGKEATVGPDGRFESDVPLEAGTNRIAVRSVDRFGRTADETETLEVDRRPPPVKARTEGWQ